MQQRIKVIRRQLNEYLKQQNLDGLSNLFDITHPSDMASVLDNLDLETARDVFIHMPPSKQATVLAQVSSGRGSRMLEALDESDAVPILEKMPPDDAADVFLELDKPLQERLLSSITDEEFRRILIDLVSYPADSAGGIMTTEYIAVSEESTVDETIEAIREQAAEAEVVYYIYTVDEDNRLSGALSLRRLLQTDPSTPVREIARRDLIKVSIESDQEEAAKIMDRYGLLAVPVVDHQDRMRGIITTDDAVDILELEATEDIYKQAGLSPFEELESERTIRLSRASLWSNFSLRIPWLVIVCVGTLVTASSVSLFEPYLQKYVELAYFMPVIAAMGGNIGAQSTTIFVRGLVLGEIDTSSFWRPFLSEIYATGFGIGIFFGIVLGLSAWSWQVYLRGQAASGHAMDFGLAVGVSMFFATLAASANGFLIPWVVSSMGADPAAASNPLLTTVQDLVGIFIYFSCSALFLSHL